MAHCNQCGWDWDARVPAPAACTKCKRYDWREPKKGDGYETRRNGRGGVRVLRDNGVASEDADGRQTGDGKGVLLPERPLKTVRKNGFGKTSGRVGRGKKVAGSSKRKDSKPEDGEVPVLLEDGEKPEQPHLNHALVACLECHCLNGLHAKGCKR